MRIRKDTRSSILNLLIICALFLGFTSCVSTEKLKYMHRGGDYNLKDSYFNKRIERIVRPYDNLYIRILSIDGQSVVSILETQSGQSVGSQVNLIYYQVNDSGNINIPFVEDIHIGGLSLAEAKVKIEKELSGYFVNPSVIIKFVNTQVTVLGEVARPGTYPYYKDPISIFQAIGMAGGITQYGNKAEVVLVREENNLITRNIIDLTDKEIMESYFYYMKPDDVIFVDPIKAKFYGKGVINYSTFLTTITTLVAVLYFFQIPAQ